MLRSDFFSAARFIPFVGLMLAACHRSPVNVNPSALEVGAAISNPVIATSTAHDTTTVTVSVRNPRWRPVVVQLGGPPYTSGNIPAAQTHGVGFGVRVVSVDSGPQRGPSRWTWGQRTITLGARETLRYATTIEAAGGGSSVDTGLRGVSPGTYHVIASFGKHEAVPPLELRVLP